VSGRLDPGLGVQDLDEEWRRRSPPKGPAEAVLVVLAVMTLHYSIEGAWFCGICRVSGCSALQDTDYSIAWPFGAAIYGAHGAHFELDGVFIRDSRWL
jgi:hypothetical protein